MTSSGETNCIERLKHSDEAVLIFVPLLMDFPKFDAGKPLNFLSHLWFGLNLIQLDKLLKSPEKSLSSEWHEASRQMREGPFLKIVDKVLQALEENSEIPQKDLASIVCQGEPDQRCTVCQGEITAKRPWTTRALTYGKLGKLPNQGCHL